MAVPNRLLSKYSAFNNPFNDWEKPLSLLDLLHATSASYMGTIQGVRCIGAKEAYGSFGTFLTKVTNEKRNC